MVRQEFEVAIPPDEISSTVIEFEAGYEVEDGSLQLH